MPIDLSKYKLENNLDKYKLAPEAPAKSPSLFDKVAGFAQGVQDKAVGFASRVAAPFTKVAVSGVRSLQAIPTMLKGPLHQQEAQQIMEKPLFGQQTLQGSTNLQNLGTAAEAGSFLAGSPGTVGLLQGGGGYLAESKNPTVLGTAGSAALGYLGGKILGKLGGKATEMATTPKTLTPELKASLEVTKPLLSNREQTAAIAQGKSKTTGPLGKVEIEPTLRDIKVAQDAAPFVNKSKTASENIKSLQNGVDSLTNKIRVGVENSKAIWNQNELKSQLSGIEKPITVKSDKTLNNQAENFRKAVLQLAEKADKKTSGLLDLRQSFDALVKKEFPNLYEKEMTPMRQYIKSVRDTLNGFTESKLPEGQLLDGTSFRDSLRQQSNLISAIDNIAEKSPRDGQNYITAWIKANPGKMVILKGIGLATGGYEVANVAKRIGIPIP